MAYPKNVWADGDNRYDIKTQASAIVTADIKLIYVGTATGTAISQTVMNNIENGIDAISKGQHNFATATYSSGGTFFFNSTTVLTAVYTALNTGLVLNFYTASANTGTATLKVDSLTASNLYKVSSSGKVNLSIGDIISSGTYTCVYDGTDMILLNPCPKNPINSGTFAETTAITASGTYEKNVALGDSDYQMAIVMFADNSGNDYGGIVMTGITATSAISNYSYDTAASAGYNAASRTTETHLGGGSGGTGLKGISGSADILITDCYINGSNLYFKWSNIALSDRSLAITVHWRVIR